VDRPIDPAVHRSRQRRRLAAGLAVVLVVAASWWLLGRLLAPSVSASRIRTATVDRGPVEATISASGLVVPEIEQVVTSPVDARVLRILKRAGDAVSQGQPLVQLDVNEARLAVDTLAQDVAIKANDQARQRLALDKSLIDLNAREEVKRLQLESFRTQLARDRQLHAEGLLSEELLRTSELAEAQAAIELQQIQAERANAQQATRAELAGLDLEMGKLRKEAAEARRQLDLAALRADREGVVTWVVTQEGVAIRKGDPVARVADLTSFRVEATVSDVQLPRLSVGQPVSVRLSDGALEGTLASINPTITNGLVTVSIALRERSNPALRPNLRVDALIVTDRKPQALRIRRGPFATGEGTQDVFVLRGDRAVRAPVTFGLASFDHFEVVAGLNAGDEVVISDMREYRALPEVRIR
jgi:HlyD family secretion protein